MTPNDDRAFFDEGTDHDEASPAAQRRALREGLSRFLQHLLNEKGRPVRELNLETIGLRTIAALWTINPELMSSACGGLVPSSCQLARAIKRSDGESVSAAIISRYSIEFRDTFQISISTGRTQEQRDRHAIARYKAAKMHAGTGYRVDSAKSVIAAAKPLNPSVCKDKNAEDQLALFN